MKRIIILTILLCAVAVAGDEDWSLMILLKDGGMGQERIDTVMSLSRSLNEAMVFDTIKGIYMIVPPRDMAVFDYNAKCLFVVHLRDTVRISKYPLGRQKKRNK